MQISSARASRRRGEGHAKKAATACLFHMPGPGDALTSGTQGGGRPRDRDATRVETRFWAASTPARQPGTVAPLRLRIHAPLHLSILRLLNQPSQRRMCRSESQPSDENVSGTVLRRDFPEDDDVDCGGAVQRKDAAVKGGWDVWVHEGCGTVDDTAASAVDEVACGAVVH